MRKEVMDRINFEELALKVFCLASFNLLVPVYERF
jgi:hypothetical protein